ncbi:hypothetical protein PAHAL_5G499400 [Panicum hallii]|uniref:Uncharacterized protein n=1 Tax=Panicum hallii TaxID=206008 RepID=A0A2S3HYD3_9POAL|nr:hypothetical protein PAHAL_5G499400 [Panicum hallii]
MLPSRAYAPGSRNAGSVWAWHGNARRADWPHGQGSGVGAHVRSKRRLVDWWRPGGCPVSCVHEHGELGKERRSPDKWTAKVLLIQAARRDEVWWCPALSPAQSTEPPKVQVLYLPFL